MLTTINYIPQTSGLDAIGTTIVVAVALVAISVVYNYGKLVFA